MSNDCSERICQFGVAHVDSPKGDIDASGGALTGPSVTVVKNDAIYPYGTSEQFPNMLDTDDVIQTNSAHAYAECSNKGICDRSTGTCACFDGYDGSACQRQSCPTSSAGQCSGHGVCESISTLANRDYGNVYKLWDEDTTMGCKCDGGYTGPDCSQKVCKYGADPLYYDDSANIRYANFTYQIYTYASTTVTGNYSLWFEDRTGEDWQTGPIDIRATCTEVTDALEALPNNVFPKNSVKCYQHMFVAHYSSPISSYATWIGGRQDDNYHYPKFTLAFPSNPGYLKQIAINKFLDGSRPTLYTSETTSTLNWHIYANGFTGEDTDYVPDLCEGVTVTLDTSTVNHVMSVSSTAQLKLLKACLGSSDGDETDNVAEVYNWDYGSESETVYKILNGGASGVTMTYANPHLIKLVDATQDSYTYTDQADPNQVPYPKTELCASTSDTIYWSSLGTGWCPDRNRPGFYAVVFWSGSVFKIFTRAAADYDQTTPFYVYTTTGYLHRVSPVATAVTHSVEDTNTELTSSFHSNIMYTRNTSLIDTTYFGDVSCLTNPLATGYYAADCLQKDDLVMFINTDLNAAGLAANPVYPNIYTVKNIYTAEPDFKNINSVTRRNRIVLDYGVNHVFDNTSPATIYKFTPPTGYNYVGQCSNRGICDTTTGICQCFNGYTGDNCGIQDALSA